MNKKVIKGAILIITLIIIIIVVLIIYLNNLKINSGDRPDPANEDPIQFQIHRNVKECNVTNNYFIVKGIIKDYFLYCSNLDFKSSDIEIYGAAISNEELEKSAEIERQNAKSIIYNRLYKDYIEEFKIDKENISDSFKVAKDTKTVIRKIYSFENSNNVITYIVYGVNINEEEKNENEFRIGVCLDLLNNTYSIMPQEYCEKHNYDNVKIGETIDLPINSIEGNKNNKFEYRLIQDNEVSQEYFYNYKYSMLYDVEYAYEMLDKDYRDKRFENIGNYKKYINDNYDVLKDCNILKYQVKVNGENKKFICIDNYDNYFIFNQTNISNYNMYLDTYTIESEEFTEKYNNVNDKEKAGMNVERFFEALNMNDYNYIYNHLSESFKENNYKNINNLENYLKKNLFKYNRKEYIDFSNEGDIIIIKLKVSDLLKENEEKNMNIIMKLGENTEYVMSFNIE